MFRPLMASVLAYALALACGDQESLTAPADFSRASLRATAERVTAPTAVLFGTEQRTVGLGGTAEQWAAVCGGRSPMRPWRFAIRGAPRGSAMGTAAPEGLSEGLHGDQPHKSARPGHRVGTSVEGEAGAGSSRSEWQPALKSLGGNPVRVRIPARALGGAVTYPRINC
jgi:hypothetical protein